MPLAAECGGSAGEQEQPCRVLGFKGRHAYRMAVDGTPSSSASTLIFFIATYSLFPRILAL